MSAPKSTKADTKKRIANVTTKQKKLGCERPQGPYRTFDKLECLNLKRAKERLEKKLDMLKSRPRGRPPMPCEKIAQTVKTKNPEKRKVAIEKKCDKRATNAYPPYKCKSVNGKCRKP